MVLGTIPEVHLLQNGAHPRFVIFKVDQQPWITDHTNKNDNGGGRIDVVVYEYSVFRALFADSLDPVDNAPVVERR